MRSSLTISCNSTYVRILHNEGLQEIVDGFPQAIGAIDECIYQYYDHDKVPLIITIGRGAIVC